MQLEIVLVGDLYPQSFFASTTRFAIVRVSCCLIKVKRECSGNFIKQNVSMKYHQTKNVKKIKNNLEWWITRLVGR
jgi:hypothetical protein